MRQLRSIGRLFLVLCALMLFTSVHTQFAIGNNVNQIAVMDFPPSLNVRACSIFPRVATSVKFKDNDTAYFVADTQPLAIQSIEIVSCMFAVQCTSLAPIGGLDTFGNQLLWSRETLSGESFAPIMQVPIDDVASCSPEIKCTLDVPVIGPIATINSREVFGLSTSGATVDAILYLWDYPEVVGGSCTNRRSYSIPTTICVSPIDILRLAHDTVGILCANEKVIGFNTERKRFGELPYPAFAFNVPPIIEYLALDAIFPRVEEQRSALIALRRDFVALEPVPQRRFEIEEP